MTQVIYRVSMVMESYVADSTYNALHDEDPPPAAHVGKTVHLHELPQSVMMFVKLVKLM